MNFDVLTTKSSFFGRVFVFWIYSTKFMEISFHFWWLVVSCKWRQLLYLIMCYDFRGSMNLLFFLCNVQNFILGLRINHNIILSFWPEEDIGKKYTIRNEQIFLQNIQSKIEDVSFILWNIQGFSCHKKASFTS